MRVEVRPLPEKKWHNKKGKESFAQPKAIEALYDKDTGKYATGLTDEEAKFYGNLLGADLNNIFNANEPHPFWSSKQATVKLENRTMIFNTDIPIQAVHVKLLKASKFVANSLKEYEENLWSDATHVIFDEAEEVALKATKVQKKREAYLISTKMSSDDKISMVQILSNKNLKGKSQDFIDVEIDEIIDNKTDDFLKYASMGREEVNIRASILELIYKNILTKEGSSIMYMSELIGVDYESAVQWFRSPQNSKLKVSILEKLNK